jgi:preprotein translocase subunit SecE
VARDRQRAKQRKQRRLPQQSKRDDAAGLGSRTGEGEDEHDTFVPEPRSIHRENVPGSVEHTGDVDEFEAALVSGADGEPEEDPDAADRAALGEDADPADAFGGDRNGDSIGIEPAADEEEREPVAATGGSVPATRSSSQPAHGRGGSRFANFLRASWAELQRVQWPDRRQVGQATAVVLGFVIIAGAFLGLADYVAKQVVDFLI